METLKRGHFDHFMSKKYSVRDHKTTTHLRVIRPTATLTMTTALYRIAGNFRPGQKIFVVGAQTTNILPTNEATLSTFTCNHENIIHKVTKYCSTMNVLFAPPPKINYRLFVIPATQNRTKLPIFLYHIYV